jgi:malate dehydrogenase
MILSKIARKTFNNNINKLESLSPVIISITGSSGNVGYSMIFRIASGEMLGLNQPIILNLIHKAENESKILGLKMELQDCAFPLLKKIITTSDINKGFEDADYAILAGAIPITKNLTRADLFNNNCRLFVDYGRALSGNAKKTCKVLVIANPCNTNCLIAIENSKNIPSENFHALSRLDSNRALSILALKAKSNVKDIEGLIIWGNHSKTMFADLYNTKINGIDALNLVGLDWYHSEFISRVATRWQEVLVARGSSSAASAANAAIDHMRDWVLGTDKLISMSILSNGDYGVPKNIVYSFPCIVENGNVSVVKGIKLNDFSEKMMKITSDELLKEKKEVENLL